MFTEKPVPGWSFNCPKCGCQRFYRRRCVESVVDFNRRAGTGHLRLEEAERAYTATMFVCVECGHPVKSEMAQAMETEFSHKGKAPDQSEPYPAENLIIDDHNYFDLEGLKLNSN